MRLALLGLPFSGTKTVFSALTGHVESSATAQKGRRLSVLRVPDQRLDFLAGVFKPRRTVAATVELTEFPGLFGASKTDAQSVAKAREADALVVVLRAFENDTAPHPKGSVDALRDWREVQSEMILADLAVVESRLGKLASSVKRRDNPDDLAEHAVLDRLRARLDEGEGVRQVDLSPDERKRIKGFGFLTAKPSLIILNIGESRLGQEAAFTGPFEEAGETVEALCASLEEELGRLEADERAEFMSDFGVETLAAPRVVAAAYRVLDTLTFFTYGEDECRAWNVRAGQTALDAAAQIHTDLARGFIRAEVIAYDDFRAHPEIKAVKAAGKFRLEGKDYPVQEADLIIIRHNA